MEENDMYIEMLNKMITALKEEYNIDTGKITDTFHTFDELYDYRMLYNALWVNELLETGECEVFKSKKHEDGELCFGGGWFIVVVILPNGEIIDNHYEEKYWDLFKCMEVEKSYIKYDGHTPQDVKDRMIKWIKEQLND